MSVQSLKALGQLTDIADQLKEQPGILGKAGVPHSLPKRHLISASPTGLHDDVHLYSCFLHM
jgi:hypothetical protein